LPGAVESSATLDGIEARCSKLLSLVIAPEGLSERAHCLKRESWTAKKRFYRLPGLDGAQSWTAPPPRQNGVPYIAAMLKSRDP